MYVFMDSKDILLHKMEKRGWYKWWHRRGTANGYMRTKKKLKNN
jgi:hypothetical protein